METIETILTILATKRTKRHARIRSERSLGLRGGDMRTIQKLTVLAALTSCLIPAAYAAKRFDSRRTIEPGLRIVQAPESISRAMPLAASTSPRSLTMCDAWLTSDYEADRFSTNY